MAALRRVLELSLNQRADLEIAHKTRALRRKLSSLEALLTGAEPRTASLTDMLQRIEQAHEAADRLPVDLETLQESKGRVSSLAAAAQADQIRLQAILKDASDADNKLKALSSEAEVTLKKCETAYAAATSVGLAAAFTERSKSLGWSTLFWVGGLIVSLGIGSWLGYHRLSAFGDLLNSKDISSTALAMSLVLSVVSVGAPIWFSWLATKQIGQRFRLAEDYAFKASISRAYEGFRREAARHGGDMEVKILTSALSRLDEQPLRLVESKNHGSPLQELLDTDAIRRALALVPEFADEVNVRARNVIKGGAGSSKSKREPKSEVDTKAKEQAEVVTADD